MAQQGKDYKPTDADRTFVTQCVKAGMSQAAIAESLNIAMNTLRKHFRFEIATARAHLQGKAIQVLDDSLTDGSLDAAKFVLARVSGWTENVAISSDMNITIAKDDSSL